MKTNRRLRDLFFQIVDEQLSKNDPPEVKQTFDRLKQSGYSTLDTKILIAQCIAVEMFRIMKFGEEFDEVRYKHNLEALPREPEE